MSDEVGSSPRPPASASAIGRSIVEGLLDLAYPPHCLVCHTFGPEYLCPECVSQIEQVPMPYCRRCGQPISEDHCRNCSGLPRSFTAARAVGLYSGVLRQAVHELKYGGHMMLAEPLAELMHKYLTDSADIPWNRADCIVPVPIHPVRQRLRGYNQSELLADALSRKLDIPIAAGALERPASTIPQVSLTGELRRQNLRNAFRVVNPTPIRGRTILLLDDVATTCSTLHESSLALLEAGARRVYAVCLAFGV